VPSNTSPPRRIRAADSLPEPPSLPVATAPLAQPYKDHRIRLPRQASQTQGVIAFSGKAARCRYTTAFRHVNRLIILRMAAESLVCDQIICIPYPTIHSSATRIYSVSSALIRGQRHCYAANATDMSHLCSAMSAFRRVHKHALRDALISAFSEQSKSSCMFGCCHRSRWMRTRWQVC
jgi:hypothetical protein